jgi:putative transposase
LSRLRKEPGMRFCDSIFGRLLKPISRVQLASTVERCGGNAYDKVFKSWDHLVALVFAQLGGVDSLRALEAIWNANSHHHYHLGVSKLARSTLSDANSRRPVAIFAATFERLSGLADRTLKREGAEMLRLIDATPIPLDQMVTWADWNGRTRGSRGGSSPPSGNHAVDGKRRDAGSANLDRGRCHLRVRQGLLQLCLVDAA